MTFKRPNTSIGIELVDEDFGEFSQNLGVKDGGEEIVKPPRGKLERKFRGNQRKSQSITTFIGHIGERFIQSLLPGSERISGKTGFDIKILIDGEDRLVEVKTSQKSNRSVIRPEQVEKYSAAEKRENLYFASLYYEMRNGKRPTKVARKNFKSEFWPICIYVFPISCIIYLINKIQPTGHQDETKFYGLNHHKARLLFNKVSLQEGDAFSHDILPLTYHGKATKTEPAREHVVMLHIIDHKNHPVILETIEKIENILTLESK